jgi:MerR HTH family regulatory protein
MSARSNRLIQWFFTAAESRYELAEVVRLTGCSRDDIQNWVRRRMISPDETTPGRRIYSPTTLADLVVAARLRRNGMTANHALMVSKVVTLKTFQWIAREELPEGVIPPFKRDFRDRVVVFYVTDAHPLTPWKKIEQEPPELGVELLPGILYAEVLSPDQIVSRVNESAGAVTVIRIHWLWDRLARTAQQLKSRPSKRLSAGAAP